MDNNSPQVTGPNAQQQFQVDDIPGEPMLLLLLVLGLLVSVGIIWYCYYVEMRRVTSERREARVTNNVPSRPEATPEQEVDERSYSKSGLPPIVVMPGGDLAFGQLVPEDVEAAPGGTPAAAAAAAEGSGQAPNEEDTAPSKMPIIWTSLTLSRSATLHDLLHRASVWFTSAASGTVGADDQPADRPTTSSASAASSASATSSAAASAAGSAAGREAAEEAPANGAAAEAAPQQVVMVDMSRMALPRSSSINSTDSLGIWYPPLTPPRLPPSARRPASQQVELAPAPAAAAAAAAEGEQGQAEAAGEERAR